jgi:hypothetical protein
VGVALLILVAGTSQTSCSIGPRRITPQDSPWKIIDHAMFEETASIPGTMTAEEASGYNHWLNGKIRNWLETTVVGEEVERANRILAENNFHCRSGTTTALCSYDRVFPRWPYEWRRTATNFHHNFRATLTMTMANGRVATIMLESLYWIDRRVGRVVE